MTKTELLKSIGTFIDIYAKAQAGKSEKAARSQTKMNKRLSAEKQKRIQLGRKHREREKELQKKVSELKLMLKDPHSQFSQMYFRHDIVGPLGQVLVKGGSTMSLENAKIMFPFLPEEY